VNTILTDKEVGELWRRAKAYEGYDVEAWQDMVEDLIRKLVEERLEQPGETLAGVLLRFGIDPATWE
jgi:hypothetical protein